MLKLLGGLMICTVCSYCGFYMSDRLKRRRDFLLGMENALSFIKTEIEFGRYDLKHIFLKIDNSPQLCGFFGICTDRIEELGIKKAWSEAADKTGDVANLKVEDKNVLRELSRELGMSDVEGQKKAINRTADHIKECRKNAEEEYARLSKTYKGCGVLLGVFFLIILI